MTSGISSLALAAPALDRADRGRAVLCHRHAFLLGSGILFVPNLILAGEVRTGPGAMLATFAVGSVAMLARKPAGSADALLDARLNLRRLCACFALALGLVVLGGEAHLVFTNWDWLWRDAVLADLVRAPFPPTYQVADHVYFLRAPLGMYMLPALVGKATSLPVGHIALLVQNTGLLALVLYLLGTLGGRRAALLIVVFLSFSGLDILGQLDGWLHGGNGLPSFGLPSHIEWWSQFQYSSVVTQIFWVPNHALPAYWLVLAVLLCARREIAVADLALLMAASLFWSPFAVIGTLPMAVYLFARDARQLVGTSRFWAAVGLALGALPIALYMQTDAAQVPHAFVLLMPGVAASIIVFLVIEIPHVAFVRAAWPTLDPVIKPIVVLAIATIVVLPVERFGVSNDLVMRASIPSLMILAITFAEALEVLRTRRKALFAGGICVVLLGAVTPATEILRSVEFAPFAISDCNLVTVWKKLDPNLAMLDNYLARRSAQAVELADAAMSTPLVDRPSDVCWPDIPVDPLADVSRLSNTSLKQAAPRPEHPL